MEFMLSSIFFFYHLFRSDVCCIFCYTSYSKTKCDLDAYTIKDDIFSCLGYFNILSIETVTDLRRYFYVGLWLHFKLYNPNVEVENEVKGLNQNLMRCLSGQITRNVGEMKFSFFSSETFIFKIVFEIKTDPFILRNKFASNASKNNAVLSSEFHA